MLRKRCDSTSFFNPPVKLDTLLSPGNLIQLQALTNQLSYSWLPENGLNCNNCYNPVARLLKPVTYIASIQDTFNCPVKQKFILRRRCDSTSYFNPRLVFDTVTYPNNPIRMMSGIGNSYLWQPAIFLDSINVQAATAILPSGMMTYVVSYLDTVDCPLKEKFVIRVRDCDTIIKSNDSLLLDTLITPGIAIQLKASKASTYSWSPGADLSCDTCRSPVARIHKNTEYIVTVTDRYQCRWTERFRLTNNCDSGTFASPVIRLDTVSYPDAQLQLNATLTVLYSWQPANNLSCSDCKNPVATIAEPVQYLLTETDSFNCNSKSTYIIRIRNCDTIEPQKEIVKLDTIIHYKTEISLNASESYNGYVWSQVKNLSCTYCQTPLLKATASADYKVAIYDRWRCLLDELFKITLIRIDVIVPNVFTPNNDGFNDYFEVKGLVPGSELQIFDKNGALVFSSKNYQGDWNGTANGGKPLDEGTYWYILNIPEAGLYKGWVYIKRP